MLLYNLHYLTLLLSLNMQEMCPFQYMKGFSVPFMVHYFHIDGHFVYFLLFAIINDAIMNIHIYIFSQICE